MGFLLIYLLVVSQFCYCTVPLIIMAPIPLTRIGILPGHTLPGAFSIRDKPTFIGLAVSPIVGILFFTPLTLVVVPLLYYGLLRRKPSG